MSSTKTLTIVDHEWSIEEFHLRQEKPGEPIFGPSFNVAGQNVTGYLSIYPRGENDDVKDYISLYLNLNNKDDDVRARVIFSLFLDGNKIKTDTFDEVYIIYEKNSDSCWGLPDFLEHSLLNYKKEDNLQDKQKAKLNTLKVHCRIEIMDSDLNARIPRCQLAEDFTEMLENPTSSDVKISVGNQTFDAHKAILAARSPVFAAMFDHDMLEKNSNIVTIKGIKPDVFKELLTFIYTGEAPKINYLTMGFQLLAAADKYDLERLKIICEVEIIRKLKLNLDYVCRILVAADRYNARLIKTECLNMIVDKATEIMDLPQWKRIEKDHPHLVSEAFRAQALAAKTSQQLPPNKRRRY